MELDKEEFRIYSRQYWPPGYTDRHFDKDWNEFIAFLAEVEACLMQRTLH